MSGKPDIAISDAEWLIVRDILTTYATGYSVWAFGSRARHTHKPFSDLDIVVVGDQPLTIPTLAALNEAFTESDLPWKVDIVDAATISDTFRSHIEAQKVALQ
jgi:predicted nucleotidyltransferase